MQGLLVGIDLVSVDDVARSIDRFGARYLDRVFAPSEVAECGGPDAPRIERLAARVAAKEAAFKVLRPGSGDPLPWTDVVVARHPDGFVSLRLGNHAARLAERAGIASMTLSLAHEGPYATAIVAATTTQPATHDRYQAE